MLPAGDDGAAEVEDPREELVQRLLEYKKYKDAASMLEEQSRQWQQRFTRLADDLPPRRVDPADQPIHEVELWDLVSALGRVIRDASVLKPSSIIYDETPIQVYMQRIHAQLVDHGRMAFSEVFDAGMHKSALIGMFLSILELVRHHAFAPSRTTCTARSGSCPATTSGNRSSSPTSTSTAASPRRMTEASTEAD